MKLGMINSIWLGSEYEGRRGLEKVKEIGFDAVDVLADPLDLDPAAYDALVQDVKAVGLEVPSVIVVAVGFSDFNPSIRRFHIERAKRHVDLGADVGAKIMVVALGEYIWQHEVIPPEAQWHWAVDTTRELGDYAAGKGLVLAMELEPFRYSLINTVNKLVKFIEDVDHQSVRANVDCSHLWLMDHDPQEILKLRGQIVHTHFSDCNGEIHQDLPPGRGNTPLRKYLAALADAGFDGVISLELEYAPHPDRIVEWATEAYEATATMMAELGVRAPTAGDKEPAAVT
jgi:D-psicose/D-tagatose/L-ribulose 3-epimerase